MRRKLRRRRCEHGVTGEGARPVDAGTCRRRVVGLEAHEVRTSRRQLGAFALGDGCTELVRKNGIAIGGRYTPEHQVANEGRRNLTIVSGGRRRRAAAATSEGKHRTDDQSGREAPLHHLNGYVHGFSCQWAHPAYAAWEPWFLVGGTAGLVKVSSERTLRPILGVWEAAPYISGEQPNGFTPLPRCSPCRTFSVAIGYRRDRGSNPPARSVHASTRIMLDDAFACMACHQQ